MISIRYWPICLFRPYVFIQSTKFVKYIFNHQPTHSLYLLFVCPLPLGWIWPPSPVIRPLQLAPRFHWVSFNKWSMCGPVNLQQIFAAFPAGGVIRQTKIDTEFFGRYGRKHLSDVWMYYINEPEGKQHSNGSFAVSFGDIVVTYIYTNGGSSIPTGMLDCQKDSEGILTHHDLLFLMHLELYLYSFVRFQHT